MSTDREDKVESDLRNFLNWYFIKNGGASVDWPHQVRTDKNRIKKEKQKRKKKKEGV